MSLRARHSVSLKSLPARNLAAHPKRTAQLAVLVALLGAALFAGSYISLSLGNGLHSVSQRLGADLVVVPQNSTASYEGSLLRGEPSSFYLNDDVLDQVQQVSGVAQASGQFYLASAAADCCASKVQIIGFDPSTDFSVQPWIAQRLSGSLGDGGLVVGSKVRVADDSTIKLYGVNVPVVARLDETGTGLDLSVFGTMPTVRALGEAAEQKGFQLTGNVDDSCSAVLVKVAPGSSVSDVKNALESQIPGIRVVASDSVVSSVSSSLGGVVKVLNALMIVLLVVVGVALCLVFSVTAGERRREFGALRVLGVTRRGLAGLILRESLLVSVLAGVVGVLVGWAVVALFAQAIQVSVGLPYLAPTVAQSLLVALLALLVCAVVGPLAASRAAWSASHTDPAILLKEGE